MTFLSLQMFIFTLLNTSNVPPTTFRPVPSKRNTRERRERGSEVNVAREIIPLTSLFTFPSPCPSLDQGFIYDSPSLLAGFGQGPSITVVDNCNLGPHSSCS